MGDLICIRCLPLGLGREAAALKTPGLSVERVIPQGTSGASGKKEGEWILRMLSKNRDVHHRLRVLITSLGHSKPWV